MPALPKQRREGSVEDDQGDNCDEVADDFALGGDVGEAWSQRALAGLTYTRTSSAGEKW